MGCNSALQDSEVLSRACIAADGDIPASAHEFDKTRLTNAQTLTRVSQRLDAVDTFNYNKDVFAALAGLPYQVTQIPPNALPLPGVTPFQNPRQLHSAPTHSNALFCQNLLAVQWPAPGTAVISRIFCG